MKKRKRWKKRTAVVLTVSCVVFALDAPVGMVPVLSSHTVAETTDQEPVLFPDQNLEWEIRDALHIYGTPITQGAMKQLTKLRFNRGITVSNLEGLQYATNLQTLSADGGIGNDIRDISPLAHLTKLEFLYLSGNTHLSDIRTLSTLTGLKTVRADGCAIQQVPDLSALKQLEKVSMVRNQIQSADFAATVSPSIKELALGVNNISDASPLAGMHNAKISLNVNHILDTSMLDWESNTIESNAQEITLPVQKTGPSQLTLANPVLSMRGEVLPPYRVEDNGIYQEASHQFIWSPLPTQPTGHVSFSFLETSGKGAPYSYSGIITVPYEVVVAAPVTVRYVDTSGNTVAPETTLTGEYGTDYAAQAMAIPTYTLTGTPQNATGTYTESTQTVTFVYEKAAAAAVTVHYESTTGKTIAPEEVLTGKLEATYTATAKTIPGYTLTEQPTNAQGTFTDTAQMVRFIYQATAGAPITVQYLDEAGNALLPEIQLDGTFDDTYQAEALTIAHYTLQEAPSNASGTFTLEPQTVTYRYARTQGETVTVSYVDTDGKTLSPATQLTGAEGAAYHTAPKAITGYHVLRITGQETGMYSTEPQQVTYIYQADTEQGPVDVPPIVPTPAEITPIKGLPTPSPTEEQPSPVTSFVSLQRNPRDVNDEAISNVHLRHVTQTLPATGDQATGWTVVLGGIFFAYGIYYWRKGKC
ncbi:LPXTG cell wall anchor domain-containing protein [Listeria booriae]|uniref:LPXTG cell wall anchor domain-containing protein n=1 Tax=Listeria booriae TaxID=1552123 RepID=A0A7X1D6Z4_9LIST|nr:MucBP domain-containing protein [Listeria booriae]MBC2175045.1 LPXTG cell wall anchor domain-containing protein [Listeria booriae]